VEETFEEKKDEEELLQKIDLSFTMKFHSRMADEIVVLLKHFTQFYHK